MDEPASFVPSAPDLPEGKQWHVFLSYRSVNRVWAIGLYDVLRNHGYEVFLDQAVLIAGDDLYEHLGENLDQSCAGLVVWSSEAADSEWVKTELRTMAKKEIDEPDFRFIPITIDGSNLPGFADGKLRIDFQSYPDGPNGGELLRLLHAIGGQPMSDEANAAALAQEEAASRAATAIAAAVDVGNARRLVELESAGGLAWEVSAQLGSRAAEGLVQLGKNDEAIALLGALAEKFPRSIRPKQLLGLALARRASDGDHGEAMTMVSELYAAGERDPETVGIFGRLWMDRYNESGDTAHLRRSRDLYAEAFTSAPDDYYTGINAAAKSVFLGELDTAADYAIAVESLVGTEPVDGDYWMTATVAETQLILQRWDLAANRYADAVARSPEERGSHRSTWGQAQKLMQSLSATDDQRSAIDAIFDREGGREAP